MSTITSLSRVFQEVKKLVYSSPTLELSFSPTFEVDRETWEKIQAEAEEISLQIMPKIPYELKDSYMSFNYMGVKTFIRPIQQPYKNSEVVNIID